MHIYIVIAAFIKRFARLALSSPASGCLVAMCFIYNLLRCQYLYFCTSKASKLSSKT